MNLKKKSIGISIVMIIIVSVLVILIKKHKADTLIRRDYKEIESANTLNIVTTLDPVGYFVSSDTISGFNHELIKALQQYTNLNFKVSLEYSLEESFKKLKSGQYDIIARNIPITSDLKNTYSFTKPIVLNKLVLVQLKDPTDGNQPIRNLLKLAKKTIYVPKSSPVELRLRNLSTEIGDTIFIVKDSVYETTQLATMVAVGDIDYTVADEKTAQILASKMPELDIETQIGFTHLEGWAVRSNSPELLDSLNAWIDRFKTTDKFSKLYSKYYK